MAKILVIDDDAQIRSLLDKRFGQMGHTVVPVPELAQALAKIGREAFDLVVLDLQLRGEQGATFLRNIRNAKNDIPVVVYSGTMTEVIEQELRKAGANEVVSKEGGISELLQQVDKILKAGKRLFVEPATDRVLLIIDDDEAIRNLLKQFFSKRKYRVLEAADGEQGLAVARATKINCVLLDVHMKGMSGLDVLPKLLEIDPRIGVIMISGEGDGHIVKKAMADGAYGYVMKPFDFVYLDLTVASKLAIASSG